ncbi:MAG: hypothetical protein M0P61_05700 [Ignavibacteriaceae bacterium]|jgi:hypothetical protein|nr:hypothetical protein [Ignavibacteriaceae bacterium]
MDTDELSNIENTTEKNDPFKSDLLSTVQEVEALNENVFDEYALTEDNLHKSILAKYSFSEDDFDESNFEVYTAEEDAKADHSYENFLANCAFAQVGSREAKLNDEMLICLLRFGFTSKYLNPTLKTDAIFANELLLALRLEKIKYELTFYKQIEIMISELRTRLLATVEQKDLEIATAKIELIREKIHIIFFMEYHQEYQNDITKRMILLLTISNVFKFILDFYDFKNHSDVNLFMSEITKIIRENENLQSDLREFKKIIEQNRIVENDNKHFIAKLNRYAEELEAEYKRVTIISVARKCNLSNSTFRGQLKYNDTQFIKKTQRFHPIQKK